MPCQYCKKDKVLCRAHIIPESFIRFMYPNGKIEGNSMVILKENKDYAGYRRVGLYDDTILCSECDEEIGRKYDEYGKNIFIDTEPELVNQIGNGNALVFKDADANSIKLFLLSVFWRFSKANISDLEAIKIPAKFEDKLLEMIKNNDPGDLNDFSILITRFAYQSSKKELRKYFQLPQKTRIKGINYWNLYLPNGYKILIKMDKKNQLQELIAISIDDKKPVYVIQHEDFEKTWEFKKLAQNVHKIKKWD